MKYCDLVMKGGITSGIVYPNAVLGLSKDYHFKNIGGTSAGAIAAAACAAAALGDRNKTAKATVAGPSDKTGFAGLATVSRQLSTEGFIFSLFQPAPGARNAFRLMVALTGKGKRFYKCLWLFGAIFLVAPMETIAVLAGLEAIAYWIGRVPGFYAALVPAIVCACAAGAIAAAAKTARVVRRNMLGLCSGANPGDASGKNPPALTDWLHGVIQDLAGKPMDAPVTFRDLWDAPRYDNEPKTPRAITLKMIATSVSHHEPRSLPFETGNFWFRQETFALLFPASVVEALCSAVVPTRSGTFDYYPLPAHGDLPILVAARMSLSFPLLISAVPLYEQIHDRDLSADSSDQESTGADTDPKPSASLLESTDQLAEGGGAVKARVQGFRICWFSDGGICSNFPIHLFDAQLPVWPTFAINLVYPKTDDRGPVRPDVWLPTDNKKGWQHTYQSIASPGAATEIAGFLFGIIDTMQNWRDLLMSRASGQRDRIVHVALNEDEGGLNLRMSQPVLDEIVKKGERAGAEFSKFSFANHYWIRWRNLSSGLQRLTTGVAGSFGSSPPIPDYQTSYEMPLNGQPEPPSYKFKTEAQRAAAEKLFADLTAQGKSWKADGPDLSKGAPHPPSDLRNTPTY